MLIGTLFLLLHVSGMLGYDNIFYSKVNNVITHRKTLI